ncbi:MAG: carboxypeptidase-like regulatory domain-containing protein [Candidatus Aenigmatarchaeota archaeon]
MNENIEKLELLKQIIEAIKNKNYEEFSSLYREYILNHDLHLSLKTKIEMLNELLSNLAYKDYLERVNQEILKGMERTEKQGSPAPPQVSQPLKIESPTSSPIPTARPALPIQKSTVSGRQTSIPGKDTQAKKSVQQSRAGEKNPVVYPTQKPTGKKIPSTTNSRLDFNGKFVGWVQDGDTEGFPGIGGAYVEARSLTADFVRGTRTDNNGYFELEVLPGIYSISAKAEGFVKHTKMGIQVSEVAPAGVHFLLHRIKRVPRATQPTASPTTQAQPIPPRSASQIGREPPPPPDARYGGELPEIRITASPNPVVGGQSTIISWESRNATRVRISIQPPLEGVGGWLVSHSGSRRTAPLSVDTTFTATAIGPGGEATAEVTVYVREKTESEKEEERRREREKQLFGKVKERLGIGKERKVHETRWFQWLQDHIITLIFSIVFFLLLKFWLYPLIVNKIPFIGGALGRGVIFSWGIPLLVSTLFFYTIKDKGWWGTIKTLIPWGIGLLLFLILFGTHIQWTNFNYWLDRLDALKFIGVPQESIDDIKNNIKSALGFLQFKAVEPKKPEAKKIGGFEAIELKFGSKYNNFVPPQLFARTNYTLPVTVKNPNKIDTKLEVENFVIEEVFLNNRGNRVICGGITDKDGKETDKIELGKISPEEERLVTINFGNKTKCAKDSKSPLSPVKFRIVFKGTPDKNPEVNNKKCVEQCDPIVDKTNKTYGLSPGNMLDESGTVYISSSRECECKVKRIHNIMDELCFFDNDKAQVTLRSTYEFKVQGKGELIIVKTEADRKLAPPPTITSSAGPLTVTTYFVSDVHIPGKSKTSTMFIEISNKGNGGATITDFKVNGVDLRSEGPLTLQGNLVKISQCQPSIINFIEDAFTLSCSVSVDDSEVNSKVTGAYLTVPVIVDINYSYSQTHSTTINVEKAVIPEGVEDYDKIIELDGRFKHLPYYCPNEKSQIAGTPALKIYDIQSSS